MKKTLISIGAIAVLAGVLVSSPVLAQNKVEKTEAKVASSTIKKASKLDKASIVLQERADKEIGRRLESLNKLQEKIQEMKKLSPSNKASLVTTVQGQISLMNNLKIKINSESTDIATLKTDVQSITKAYRIYALILPQIEIIAGAEKLSDTADAFTAYVAKLQTLVTSAQNSGKSVSTLQTLINDMTAKIASVKTQSEKVIADVVILKPDNGVKSVQDANKAVLNTARNTLRSATQSLKLVQKDSVRVRIGLKDISENRSATSTKEVEKKVEKGIKKGQE